MTSDAATGLMAESVEQQKLIGAPNQIEAVMSNLQKRAASSWARSGSMHSEL